MGKNFPQSRFYSVEISPSNRAECKHCHNRIQKGTMRLCLPGRYYANYRTYDYYCSQCGINMIEDDMSEIDKIYYCLKDSIKQEKKEREEDVYIVHNTT